MNRSDCRLTNGENLREIERKPLIAHRKSRNMAEKSRPNKERSKRFLESCHVLTKEPLLKSSLTRCGCYRQQSRSGQMTKRLDDLRTKNGFPASARLFFWCDIVVPIWGRSFLLHPCADVSSRGEPSDPRSSSGGRVPRALLLVCFACPEAAGAWGPS